MRPKQLREIDYELLWRNKVFDYYQRQVGEFTLSDIKRECFAVSRDMIKIIFRELQKAKRIKCLGKARAPESKKDELLELIGKYSPVELENTDESAKLAEMYIERRIVPQKKKDDALHVAIATIFELDAVITWNFSHLANLRKAELFNAVNLEMGYTKRIEIVTPLEVSGYEGV